MRPVCYHASVAWREHDAHFTGVHQALSSCSVSTLHSTLKPLLLCSVRHQHNAASSVSLFSLPHCYSCYRKHQHRLQNKSAAVPPYSLPGFVLLLLLDTQPILRHVILYWSSALFCPPKLVILRHSNLDQDKILTLQWQFNVDNCFIWQTNALALKKKYHFFMLDKSFQTINNL